LRGATDERVRGPVHQFPHSPILFHSEKHENP
jgi:hypothetical protein